MPNGSGIPVNWASDSSELYIEGYYLAARMLRLQIQAGKGSRTALIFPVGYLYRHYIELRLKSLVRIVCGYLEIEPKINLTATHSLQTVWGELKPLIPQVDIDFGDELFELVEDAVEDISYLDSASTAFRYDRDKKENRSLSDLESFDLEHLGEAMHDIHWALEGLAFTVKEKLNQRRLGNL